MKSNSPVLRAALLLAALLPLTVALVAADPANAPAAAPAPEAPLHEIGAAPAAPAQGTAPTPAATVTPAPKHDAGGDEDSDGDSDSNADSKPRHRHHHDDGDENRVSVGDATVVEANATVPGNAVAIFGPVKVYGTVEGNAVSVFGSNTIEGTVHGNAVVVFGTLHLGSHAHVDGNVVAGIGLVSKDPGAYVGGNVVQQGSKIDFSDDSEASNWWNHGLRMGRPLALGHHLHVFWLINACFVVLYVLLVLLFPEGARKCGETLAKRPGITFLTGVLAMIALPVVFVLLCITVVGIPVALIVLPLAVMSCMVFGRASIYALVGRAIVGKEQHPALAVLVGALVVMLVYLIPVIGIALWIVVGFLGFACALMTLMTTTKAPAVPGAPPVIPVPPVVGAAPAPGVPEPTAVPAEAAPLIVPAAFATPPPVMAALAQASEAALPRAGFWIRMVALLIDGILIGALTQMHDLFLPVLAAYGAILWKHKGSTIGGIIFGIKVVRMDSRPVDWMTAIVRALACFISLIALGLGFIWIAFDPEKQGWHDKIAGTVVVRLPKGVSLV
jgi:uncharacterized RDD family membrane protein YckC